MEGRLSSAKCDKDGFAFEGQGLRLISFLALLGSFLCFILGSEIFY